LVRDRLFRFGSRYAPLAIAAWCKTALRVTIDSVLVQSSEPKAAVLDGSVVVLSVRAGAYFGFNRVASEIWQMLAAPCCVGRIVDALCESHDVDRETVVRDVTPFLQTLLEQKLARVSDPVETG
jgi:Coenzyme PQQ synthesis protein D (PqqD)